MFLLLPSQLLSNRLMKVLVCRLRVLVPFGWGMQFHFCEMISFVQQLVFYDIKMVSRKTKFHMQVFTKVMFVIEIFMVWLHFSGEYPTSSYLRVVKHFMQVVTMDLFVEELLHTCLSSSRSVQCHLCSVCSFCSWSLTSYQVRGRAYIFKGGMIRPIIERERR